MSCKIFFRYESGRGFIKYYSQNINNSSINYNYYGGDISKNINNKKGEKIYFNSKEENEEIVVQEIQGEKGERGEQGPQGMQGEKGRKRRTRSTGNPRGKRRKRRTRSTGNPRRKGRTRTTRSAI